MNVISETRELKFGYDIDDKNKSHYYVQDMIQSSFKWFDKYSEAVNYYEQMKRIYNNGI